MSRFWIILFFCAAIAAGCELFSTRNPEPPGDSSHGGWEFPRDPGLVLKNLETAFSLRSSVDYMRSFYEDDSVGISYVFVPEPEKVANFPGLFDGWDLNRERKHIDVLFNPSNIPADSLSRLSFSINLLNMLGDSADVSASYDIHVGHIRENVPRSVAGLVEFRLLRGMDGGWVIQRWIDHCIASGQPCWSDLKAYF